MRPRLKIVRTVTPEHARIFADEWVQNWTGSGAFWDAFSQTELVVWDDEDRELQHLYQDIEDEIYDQVVAEVRAAMEAAFMRVAPPILARERHRQSRVAQYLRTFPLRRRPE